MGGVRALGSGVDLEFKDINIGQSAVWKGDGGI